MTPGNAGDYAPDVGDREPREPEPAYRLAAAGREEAEDERLGLLESIFDPGSRRRRALVQPGWRCLEIGAGRGSMAVWLARQVGEHGQVVATDIDVTYLKRLDVPNLEVRPHDILEDSLDVLGPGSFDLVCSRLMLFWLVGRQEEAIRRLAECLRPGGWLVDEDGDWGTVVPVDPAHPQYERYHRVWRNGMVGGPRIRPGLRTEAAGAIRALRPAEHPPRGHGGGGARNQHVGTMVSRIGCRVACPACDRLLVDGMALVNVRWSRDAGG